MPEPLPHHVGFLVGLEWLPHFIQYVKVATITLGLLPLCNLIPFFANGVISQEKKNVPPV